jgi:hypothetical protein
MEEQTTQAAEMEQQAPVAKQQETSTPSFTMLSDEEVAAMQQPQEQPRQQASPEVEQTQQEIMEEPQPDQQKAQPQYAPEEIEGAVLEFLSERLGRPRPAGLVYLPAVKPFRNG